MKGTIIRAILVASLASAHLAGAATIPDACQSAKTKEVGNLTRCLQSAQAKFVTSGDTAARDEAVASCVAKSSAKWQDAEQKATDKGGACRTTGDETAIADSIQAGVDCIATALETGNKSCLLCGNGAIDAGEQCDLGTLGGATCSSATSGAKPNGTLRCGSNCTLDTSGCSAAAAAPPTCATYGNSCGSCGTGFCASYSGGGLACVNGAAATVTVCSSDSQCASGLFCVSGGTTACAPSCP